MSGRKQHFIPQMVLKGFGIDRGKVTQVRVHRYDQKPFIAPTSDVGAQKYFYSEPSVGSEPTLDDQITSYENTFGKNLAHLLKAPSNSLVSPEIASEYITHLIIRNDHFRQSTSAAVREFTNRYSQALYSADTARLMLGVSSTNPGAQFKQALDEALAERPMLLALSGMDRTNLEKLAIQHVERNFASYHAATVGPILEVLGAMSQEIANISADVQRKALAQEVAPQKRVEQLTTYNWIVINSKSDLLLPDCIAISSMINGRNIPLLYADQADIENIFVPLSRGKLLIGQKSISIPTVDMQYLNLQFVRCSWDFFISCPGTKLSKRFDRQLRKSSTKLFDELVTNTMREIHPDVR